MTTEVEHQSNENSDGIEKTYRIQKYTELEKKLKCPLIVYFTSTRPGLLTMMSSSAERPFINIIEKIPASQKEIAILIHSRGGDPHTAWKLMSLLRGRFDNVKVVIPYMAYSAATMFSLGANEIIMHPYANLGPIDPQIKIKTSSGETAFAYEDLCGFFRFLKKEANVNGEDQITRLMEKMFGKLEPQSVGFAYRASEMSNSIGERMLKLHMEDPEKAKQIALNFNRSFHSHGDAISRDIARKMNLKIHKNDLKLEKLIWETYLTIESYMKMNEDFNPRTEVMKDEEVSKLLKNPLSVPIQSQIPQSPDVQAIVRETFIRNSEERKKIRNHVEYKMILDLIETSEYSEVRVEKGFISVDRNALGISINPSFSGWVNF